MKEIRFEDYEMRNSEETLHCFIIVQRFGVKPQKTRELITLARIARENALSRRAARGFSLASIHSHEDNMNVECRGKHEMWRMK